MNTKNYVISSLAAAVFIFSYGMVMYTALFADYLAAAGPPGLAIPEADQSIMAVIIGCLIQGFGLGLLYTKGHEGKGPMEGIRFGFYLGVLILGINYLMSGVSALTLRGAFTFTLVDMVMYMGAGVVFALLYKK